MKMMICLLHSSTWLFALFICTFIFSRRSIILLLVFPLLAAQHTSVTSSQAGMLSSETSSDETLPQRHHRLHKRQLDGATLPIIDLNYRIKEETNSGTFVGNIRKDSNIERLHDSKTSLSLRFRYLKPRSQVQTSLFSLNSTTGLMRTRSRIDRESLCLPGSAVCTVKVDVAVQPVEFFRIIRVTVEVEDINDHPPSFPQSILKFEVFETVSPNKTGLVLPPASDPDSPPYAVQEYRLVDSDSNVIRSTFELKIVNKTSANDLRLVVLVGLDREETPSYSLSVEAVDGGGLTGRVQVLISIIDVNDNVPIFDKDSYETYIPENVPLGTRVMSISAHDRDSGINGRVVYSLEFNGVLAKRETAKVSNKFFDSKSNPDVSAFKYFDENNKILNVTSSQQFTSKIPFVIDPDTGVITTSSNIDFEETSVYRLSVIAGDMGPDSVPARAPLIIHVIDDNDNSPEISIDTLSARAGVAEVLENMDPGTFVAHISVFDRDSDDNGQFSCSIEHGNSLLPAPTPKLFFQQNFDPDFAVFESSKKKVYERNTEAFQLKKIFDEYQIVTSMSLDFEETTSYEIAFVCKDFGEKTLTSRRVVTLNVVDVNDNSPQFEEKLHELKVYENNSPGQFIKTLKASDADSGVNSLLTFALDDESNAMFELENRTGKLRVQGRLDREEKEMHTFQVVVKDNGEPVRTDMASVVVRVMDENDEKPTFPLAVQSFTVQENEPPGTFVGMVEAEDKDVGENAKISYHIRPGPSFSLFSIDSSTGRIHTRLSLDREFQAEHRMTVLAVDSGSPNKLTGSLDVVVFVGDLNDNMPHFQIPLSSYSFFPFDLKFSSFPQLSSSSSSSSSSVAAAADFDTLSSSSLSSTTLGNSSNTFYIPTDLLKYDFVAQLRAVDLDSGPNGQITYEIVSAKDNSFPSDDDDDDDDDGSQRKFHDNKIAHAKTNNSIKDKQTSGRNAQQQPVYITTQTHNSSNDSTILTNLGNSSKSREGSYLHSERNVIRQQFQVPFSINKTTGQLYVSTSDLQEFNGKSFTLAVMASDSGNVSQTSVIYLHLHINSSFSRYGSLTSDHGSGSHENVLMVLMIAVVLGTFLIVGMLLLAVACRHYHKIRRRGGKYAVASNMATVNRDVDSMLLDFKQQQLNDINDKSAFSPLLEVSKWPNNNTSSNDTNNDCENDLQSAELSFACFENYERKCRRPLERRSTRKPDPDQSADVTEFVETDSIGSDKAIDDYHGNFRVDDVMSSTAMKSSSRVSATAAGKVEFQNFVDDVTPSYFVVCCSPSPRDPETSVMMCHVTPAAECNPLPPPPPPPLSSTTHQQHHLHHLLHHQAQPTHTHHSQVQRLKHHQKPRSSPSKCHKSTQNDCFFLSRIVSEDVPESVEGQGEGQAISTPRVRFATLPKKRCDDSPAPNSCAFNVTRQLMSHDLEKQYNSSENLFQVGISTPRCHAHKLQHSLTTESESSKRIFQFIRSSAV